MKLKIHKFVLAVVKKVCPKECQSFYHTQYFYCLDMREVKEKIAKGLEGREYYIFKASHEYIGWGYSRNRKSFLKWERKGVKMAKATKKIAKGGMKKGGKKGC